MCSSDLDHEEEYIVVLEHIGFQDWIDVKDFTKLAFRLLIDVTFAAIIVHGAYKRVYGKNEYPFTYYAFNIITSPETKNAFDLSREDDKTRDAYGRTTLGQSCLLARRLIESGVLRLNQEAETLPQSITMEKPQKQRQRQRLHRARQRLTQAERKHSMAQVLASGGFQIEALPALSDAVEAGLASVALLDTHVPSPLSITFIESHLVNNDKVPANTATLIAQLREANKGSENSAEVSQKEATVLLKRGAALMQHVAETLNKAALQ